jgi:hypothetical protein
MKNSLTFIKSLEDCSTIVLIQKMTAFLQMRKYLKTKLLILTSDCQQSALKRLMIATLRNLFSN